MKLFALCCAFAVSGVTFAQSPSNEIPAHAQAYVQQAEQQRLADEIIWHRLMYEDQHGESEVTYSGFFFLKMDSIICTVN